MGAGRELREEGLNSYKVYNSEKNKQLIKYLLLFIFD